MLRDYRKPLLLLLCCMVGLLMITVVESALTRKERTTFGVSPELLDKYTQKHDDQEFQCLYSKEFISFDAVNDNYCDCKDGSDEPGTSACSNAILSFNNDSKFFCKNKNFKSKLISHSKVNDGVCDCCDGSDENFAFELGETERAECPNTCKSLGKEIVANLISEIAIMKSAIESVRPNVEYGNSKIATLNSETLVLKDQVAELETTVAQLKTKRDELVALETVERDLLRAKKKKEKEETPAPPIDLNKIEESKPEEVTEPAAPEVDDEEVINFKTPEAEAARNALTEKETELNNLKSKLTENENKLSRNYGPNNRYYKLSEECFSLKQKQYTYEVCPYGSANQKEFSSTLLGNFKSLSEDGSVMKFEDGAHCWKVGARKAFLTLKCGPENKVTKVDEPSTCEYALEMETPYSCSEELLAKKEAELASYL